MVLMSWRQALGFFGLKVSDSYNAEALHQLLGNDTPQPDRGCWRMAGAIPDNYECRQYISALD